MLDKEVFALNKSDCVNILKCKINARKVQTRAVVIVLSAINNMGKKTTKSHY